MFIPREGLEGRVGQLWDEVFQKGSLMSRHINLNRYFPTKVLDFAESDGRWLSITVEGLLESLIERVKPDFELRVISKQGTANCLPSYQKGYGREENLKVFTDRARANISCYYLVLRTYKHHIQIFELPTAFVVKHKGKLTKKLLLEILPEECKIWL